MILRLLIITLILPLTAATALLLMRRSISQDVARRFALAVSLATLAVSLLVAYGYDLAGKHGSPRYTGPVAPRYSTAYHWFTYLGDAADADGGTDDASSFRIEMLFGIDGISVSLIVLTTLLTVSCVLISWESIRERAAGFYGCLLLLEAGLLGVFSAFDVVMFYVFFEFTLVPLFFMIGIWGGPQRRYAAIKFFLYTLVGSLVTLVGLVGLVLVSRTTSIPVIASSLAANPLSHEWQIGLFLAIAVGFMVKVPVFPLHTWLPLAHVEAPTAGSVLLAGVLLKLGTYGFLRLCLPMFPYACQTVGVPLMAALAVAGIIYGSLCALAQRDIKKLVAYSSVAHLGFCMLGLFALNAAGMAGGVLQMINHGLSTGALFLLVGMIYDRYHTRQLDDLGGLAARLPLIGCTMVFIAMASIGLPGLNGFVGEMLSLAGMFQRHLVYAALGATGVVLGAWYMLTMIQHAFFGPLREPKQAHHDAHQITDMNAREVFAIAPICVLCLVLGVMPQPVIRAIQPDIDAVVALYPSDEQPVASTLDTYLPKVAKLNPQSAIRNPKSAP
jgi:NADH-quinone oxidoreductase subunit M